MPKRKGMSMHRSVSDVAIIGGGLHGCAAAFFLARAGKRVTVIEKNLAGRHASGVNAGGLRSLMRDIRAYSLSRRAMEIWGNLPDFIGPALAEPCQVRLGVGQVAVALDAAEMEWAQTRVRDMQAEGIDTEEVIGPSDLRNLLPGVTRSALGGLISRGDGHANPARSARAFRLAAEAAGARVVEGCRVYGLVPVPSGGWRIETDAEPLEAGQVLNCAGAWGADVAALLGEALPLKAAALSLMVTARVKPFVQPVVVGINRPLSFKQTAVGSLVIGGGVIGKACPDRDTSFTVMERMARSAAMTVEAFPVLKEVPIVRTWTGLEGITPDDLPIIGQSSLHDGIWHVFGFCGEGFQLAPAVGEAVAQSIVDADVDPRLAPFAPNRFTA